MTQGVFVTLDDLEQWFKDNPPPKEVRLNRYSVITDTDKFIKSHISVLRAHSGNKGYMPYYERLIQLKKVCEDEH